METLEVVLVSLLLDLNRFQVLCGVYVVDFEQVNIGWECSMYYTLRFLCAKWCHFKITRFSFRLFLHIRIFVNIVY